MRDVYELASECVYKCLSTHYLMQVNPLEAISCLVRTRSYTALYNAKRNNVRTASVPLFCVYCLCTYCYTYTHTILAIL